MRFTIQKGDVRVEVEAEGKEAAQLLQQLLTPSGNGQAHLLPGESHPSLSSSSDEQPELQTIETIFRQYYGYLGTPPRRVLVALFEHPQGLTDIDLKAALAKNGVTTLAGSMTAIVKGAKRLSIPVNRVLEKSERRDRQRGGYFFYKLGSLASKVMQDMGHDVKKGLTEAKQP